ncbi:MAG: cobalt ECF transporter T component CbiQ [Treponema sp.]|jgi:cobalt/nickel transport system permease protein|nr:cobalt ECF transporter T component CbiQ [Treponema sp.]
MAGKEQQGQTRLSILGRADAGRELYALELLAGKNTALHRLHPGAKLISCVLFMATVISFDRYSLGRLCPFLFYPCVLIALGELPPSLLVKRTALSLPFCLFAGLSNLVLERGAAFSIGRLTISLGFLSFWALILRTLLCVAAALILIATTPWTALAAQLRRFRVPAIFVTLLELCYRYIGTLLAESDSMYTAYKLRSANTKGVALSHMGSFVGHLFLRSAVRAERVYAAMKCRGYSMKTPSVSAFPCRAADAVFLLAVASFCALFRFVDLPLLAGRLIGGFL